MLGSVETVETPCGIRAIGRPCQSLKQRGQLTGHPMHPICIAPGEVVHILGEEWEAAIELAEMVRRHGFDVRRHATASAMKDAILGEKAGCIVLDVGPLQTEGFHLFRDLQELGCTLPVIFLSGIESVKTAVECMRAGAANYICKPANQLELRDALVDATIATVQKNLLEGAVLVIVVLLLGCCVPASRLVAQGQWQDGMALVRQLDADLGCGRLQAQGQWRPARQQMRCKAVAQRMRRGLFGQAKPFTRALDCAANKGRG